MQNINITIPDYATVAINRLNAAGFEACVVGGCVRDTLIGRIPGDWDMCTAALPWQTRAVFQKDFHVIDTGIKHGTVTVVSDGHPLEITTYRTEGDYTDHRRPDSVTFISDIREDLSRRDFTVNAMAYSDTTGLIDLFGGQEDLKKRLIRCVGSAEKRFEEDALRILRALRFAAVLDFEIDEETALAAHKMSSLLENIAVERIYTELRKLLTAPAGSRIVSGFSDVINAAARAEPFPGQFAVSGDTSVAFCLYFFDAASVLTRLKAPKAVITSARVLQTTSMPKTLPDALRILGKLGRDDYMRLIEYFTHCGGETSLLRQALNCGLPCRISELAVTGSDLAALGLTPGPDMGHALNTLLDAVMEGRVKNEKTALLGAVSRLF